MRGLVFLMLIALTSGAPINIKDKKYDVRCSNTAWTRTVGFDLDSLELNEAVYERTGALKCKDAGYLKELEPTDDWETIIDRVKMLMDDHGLTCTNFPTIRSSMFVYLSTEDSYLEYRDCEWATDFCQQCGGCPYINHRTGTNRSNTLEWAKQEREDGICADRSIRDNLFNSMVHNESWFFTLRYACEHCWDSYCNDTQSRLWNDELMEDLDGNMDSWKKLCFQASVFGTMDSLHLQARFGAFDYYQEQMNVFAHYAWISDTFHLVWTTSLFALLYLWSKNCCNPWRREQRRAEEPDPVMAYVIRRLAEGKNRKTRNQRRKERAAKKRAANKNCRKKTKKTNKKTRKGKKTGKKIVIDKGSKLALRNGRVAIAKRGPCGRGGFGGRGRGRAGRGARGGQGGK